MSEMQCVNNLVSALKQWQKPYATIVRPYNHKKNVRPYKGGHITHKHTEFKGALSMQMNNTWSLILLFEAGS